MEKENGTRNRLNLALECITRKREGKEEEEGGEKSVCVRGGGMGHSRTTLHPYD